VLLSGDGVAAVGISFERQRVNRVRGRAALLRRAAHVAKRRIGATTPLAPKLGRPVQLFQTISGVVYGISRTHRTGSSDVTFREDDSSVRDRIAVRNLALMRKIALNIVGRDRTSKGSVRARRKKAAWNDSYMLQLLAV